MHSVLTSGIYVMRIIRLNRQNDSLLQVHWRVLQQANECQFLENVSKLLYPRD